MRKQIVTAPIESPELIRLYQQERQTLLNTFLSNVKEMMKDQAKLRLPKDLGSSERLKLIEKLTKPQVFLSYAWEASNTPKLNHLHTFLKQFAADLQTAGLTPWLDLQRMTGDLEKQMRKGVAKSLYVVLIGTNRYAERTKSDSDTNVRKELDFTLSEAKKSADFLLPLMLEGDYGTTFHPPIGKNLIRDGRSWYSLEQGQWQSWENYLHELTQCEPLGILPVLLGLNRLNDYPAYRRACLKHYKRLQQALMTQWELLKTRREKAEQKQSHPGIPLTMALQIPFRALEYDKKADLIGRGSYGDVYRGHWQGQTTGQAVAIKEFAGALTLDAEKDLYREAGIMARLGNVSKEPYHTVRLFGLAVEKPKYALVMEYVPNGTLFNLLQSGEELPWDLRYQLAADIADGIALLHRQQPKPILHRDLRSHNVLLYILDGRLRAKLSDFGLSTVKSSVRTITNRKTASVGTLAWMAPELLKRGDVSSPASDIYSYGMILWELLTHKTPFADANGDQDLIRGWVKDGEQEKIPEDCPPVLAKLIGECWKAKPEDRITIAKIQWELAKLMKVHPLSSETQEIIATLKKNQADGDEKWNARQQTKQFLAEQKQKKENQRQLELEKMKKKMEQLESAHEQLKQQAERQSLAEKKQMEKMQLQQEHQVEFKRYQKETKPTSTTPTPSLTSRNMYGFLPATDMQRLMAGYLPRPPTPPKDLPPRRPPPSWFSSGRNDQTDPPSWATLGQDGKPVGEWFYGAHGRVWDDRPVDNSWAAWFGF